MHVDRFDFKLFCCKKKKKEIGGRLEQFTLYTENLITLEKHKDVKCVLN